MNKLFFSSILTFSYIAAMDVPHAIDRPQLAIQPTQSQISASRVKVINDPMLSAGISVSGPFGKTSNVLDETLRAEIRTICETEQNSFEALNAVAKKVADSAGQLADTLLLHRLLNVKASAPEKRTFHAHVKAILEKIVFYKNDVQPSSCNYFFQLIHMLYLDKLSDIMKKFVIEVYINKYESINLEEMVLEKVRANFQEGLSEGNVYFLSNKKFLVGFEPNKINQDQNVVLYEYGPGGWVKSNKLFMAQSIPLIPEPQCVEVLQRAALSNIIKGILFRFCTVALISNIPAYL